MVDNAQANWNAIIIVYRIKGPLYEDGW
jgi:hypothetical protein